MTTTTQLANILAVTTAIFAGACGGVPQGESGEEPSAQALGVGPTTVAYGAPVGLSASTGNLYWTTHSINELGPDSATLWRAGKTNTPGHETALYRESGDTPAFYYFGSVAYAFVGGTWFGYFVANYDTAGVTTSQIKRVPLTGSTTATILATSPAAIGTRDLATDGTTLFWADAGGIRRQPIGGGAVTTIVSSTGLSRIGLDATNVYYADGATIRHVPKLGGAPTTIHTGDTVTALDVDAATRTIYFGEHGGAVKSTTFTGGVTLTHQAPIAGRDATSVGFDGTRVLWTDCVEPGNTSCAVRKRQGGVTTTISSGSVGAGRLQWDATSMYWGDASGLKKYVH